ncbi:MULTISPECIES: biotin/lipoyl-containing protein [unclassified Bradyrhizobium]|nr:MULTISPECIES: biotin/lipoyl-containing protein [unclassified Bradyrhizobium]
MAGDVLAIMESMKMEISVLSPAAGRIASFR